jgi:serine/threonine protein kinase
MCIINVVGSPDDETLANIGSEEACNFIRQLPHRPRVDFSKLIPQASPLALDLLEKMLVFGPDKRLTIEQALSHPFLTDLHDGLEPISQRIMNPNDFVDGPITRVEYLKELIYQEMLQFHH